MRDFDRHQLSQLTALADSAPRVSIYQPTHRAGREVRQGPIRLKNLTVEAKGRLQGRGLTAAEADDLLAPALALVDRTGFWERQRDGLAVLVDRDGMRAYRCPRSFDELCYVHDHFHLKPLLPLLADDGSFYLLALSLNQVRLYAGTREGLEEVDLGPIPASLPAALGHELEQPSLQHHAAADGAIFHGQGGGEDDRTVEIVRFLQMVEGGLRERLGEDGAPVVVAGVEEMIHRFHHECDHPALVPGGVKGSPDSLGPQRLHAQAWDLARPVLMAGAERAAERYRDLIGSGLAVRNLREIGPAVVAGRVETLFVAADRQVWGRFAADGAVEIHRRRRDDDVDLLDRFAVTALARGTAVHARRSDRLPDRVPAAAVLRY